MRIKFTRTGLNFANGACATVQHIVLQQSSTDIGSKYAAVTIAHVVSLLATFFMARDGRSKWFNCKLRLAFTPLVFLPEFASLIIACIGVDAARRGDDNVVQFAIAAGYLFKLFCSEFVALGEMFASCFSQGEVEPLDED